MKLHNAGLAILLFLTALVASGKDNVDDLQLASELKCGPANAFGAIQHLPAVRVVAYDPVTNSFGFIRCIRREPVPGKEASDLTFNEDYLDRQRLALDTQKIRLLVLPYNTKGIQLTMAKSNGNGVEFQAIFNPPAAPAKAATDQPVQAAGTPPAKTADAKIPSGGSNGSKSTDTTASTTTTAKAKKKLKATTGTTKTNADVAQEVKTSQAARDLRNALQDSMDRLVNTRVFDLKAAIADDASKRINVQTPAETLISPSKDPLEILAGVAVLIDEYRERAGAIEGSIGPIGTGAHCLNDSLSITVSNVTKTLQISDDVTKGGDESTSGVLTGAKPFSLAYDRTLDDVLNESKRRLEQIRKQVMKAPACVQGPDSGGIDYDSQVHQLDLQLDARHAALITVGIPLDDASDALSRLPNTPPKDSTTTADDWKKSVAAYTDTVNSLKTYQKNVQKQIDDTRTTVDALIGSHAALVEALLGPGASIQRFNYPPLKDNESISFAFQRAVIDPKATAQPVNDANSIELRSAPTDAVRFSTGVVRSGLRNPSFTTVDVPDGTVDSTGKANVAHEIVFSDQGNGTTLPGVFIHHYWTRRCALLQPTALERWVPTLSLGLPLAKSAPLEQVLLGLDWELIPGVELNTGMHYGKANQLDKDFGGKPLTVGSTVPATLDITKIQSQHYTSAFYLGISINTEAWAALVGNRQ